MSPEKCSNFEGAEAKKREVFSSFDELYEVIRSLDSVEGTRKTYNPEEIIGLIEEVRRGDVVIEYVTRADGIRKSVEELLLNDPVYRKNVLEKNNL